LKGLQRQLLTAVAPAETKLVPVEVFPALTSGRRAAVFAEAKAAPVEGPSTQKVEGASASLARCKTALGDESAAPSSDGAVAAHLLTLRQRLLGNSQRLEVCRAFLAGVVIGQDSSQDKDG